MTELFPTIPNAMATTVTVTTDNTNGNGAVPLTPVQWEGVLAVEGVATEDGRYLMPGLITERDLPLTLMAQFVTAEGHDQAQVAGKITEIWRSHNSDLGAEAIEIWGRGEFDTGDVGTEAARLVENEVLRGISIDMGITERHLLDASTLEEVDPNSLDFEELMTGDFVVGMEGTILGATLCAFPAFAEASLRIMRSKDAATFVACGYPMNVRRGGDVYVAEAFLASGGKLFPADWFSRPEPDHLVGLTVTPEGQVFGHIAPWNQCHTAFPESCQLAPRSKTGYAHFHTGEVDTDDGLVAVGTITVGRAGHASIGLSFVGAIEHYDKTGSVGAFVRATDGEHGIWVTGAVRPDAPDEIVRDLRAYAPSGDWRWDDKTRNLEMVAALCVPVQGFPVPRSEAALVSSADGDYISALVATAVWDEQPLEATRDEQRRLAILTERGRAALSE